MPTAKEFYNYFDDKFPSTLSCSWDNDGLMCCASPMREVKKVLITLDITDTAIDYAVNNGFDLILAHHPLIFDGIKHLNFDNGTAARLLKLVKADITAMSFHTRLDAVSGGVNDTLAELLNLSDIKSFESEGIELGRYGKLPYEMSQSELALYIKEKLNAPYVNYNGTCDKIRTLAVIGGGGKDDIDNALKTESDAYLTGELGHHKLTDACDFDITLFEAGHYYTEFPVCNTLSNMVKDKYPDIEVEVFDKTDVKYI